MSEIMIYDPREEPDYNYMAAGFKANAVMNMLEFKVGILEFQFPAREPDQLPKIEGPENFNKMFPLLNDFFPLQFEYGSFGGAFVRGFAGFGNPENGDLVGDHPGTDEGRYAIYHDDELLDNISNISNYFVRYTELMKLKREKREERLNNPK